MSSTATSAALGPLATKFLNAASSDHASKWTELWEDNCSPWDRGGPSLALLDVLTEQAALFAPSSGRKRALVPGCGRGHDVLLLSSFGYEATGLDCVQTAIDEAKANAAAHGDEEIYQARDASGEKGSVSWVVADFFDPSALGDVKFDLIFDYTFLCALPVDLRASWSLRMSQLLSPTGRLVCLEFPRTKSPAELGPPWACPSKVHLAHLQHPGKTLAYVDGDLQEAEVPVPEAGCLQRLAYFQPRRTHRAGYDAEGSIVDRVSVWGYP